MHLRAISVGYAVPCRDFDASVHSVFRSAVNLQPKEETRLLTLLSSDGADLPQGIRLDTPNGFSFEELPVGINGVCRGGILSLENSALITDLRSAKRWDGRLLTLSFDLSNPMVEAAWRSAWQMLNDQQAEAGSELIARDLFCHTSNKQSFFIKQISTSLSSILEMTRQCRLADERAIRSVVGLGTGLTPSGDDLLVGYLAGLWCAANGKRERLDFLSDLREAVIRLSDETNDISRTYLYHAAHGHISGRLDALASAICAGAEPRRIRDWAETAMQTGHTSGMDAVTGLLLGFMAWNGFL